MRSLALGKKCQIVICLDFGIADRHGPQVGMRCKFKIRDKADPKPCSTAFQIASRLPSSTTGSPGKGLRRPQEVEQTVIAMISPGNDPVPRRRCWKRFRRYRLCHRARRAAAPVQNIGAHRRTRSRLGFRQRCRILGPAGPRFRCVAPVEGKRGRMAGFHRPSDDTLPTKAVLKRGPDLYAEYARTPTGALSPALQFILQPLRRRIPQQRGADHCQRAMPLPQPYTVPIA